MYLHLKPTFAPPCTGRWAPEKEAACQPQALKQLGWCPFVPKEGLSAHATCPFGRSFQPQNLLASCDPLACMRAGSLLKPVWPLCFQANKADAVTLDGGLVYEAGLEPYKLRPVAAEVYGTEESEFPLEPRAGVAVALALGSVESEWMSGLGGALGSIILEGTESPGAWGQR